MVRSEGAKPPQAPKYDYKASILKITASTNLFIARQQLTRDIDSNSVCLPVLSVCDTLVLYQNG